MTNPEYWAVIGQDTPSDWSMITLCVRLAGAEIVPAAVLWEGMDEAKALAGEIVADVYRLTGTADVKGYYLKLNE